MHKSINISVCFQKDNWLPVMRIIQAQKRVWVPLLTDSFMQFHTFGSLGTAVNVANYCYWLQSVA